MLRVLSINVRWTNQRIWEWIWGRPFHYALRISAALWLLAQFCPFARADVGVVLNESLDEDMDRISSTGHSAIYLSRVCAESPVKLRLCRQGESGSIVSNYINIGEDQPFEWNAVPLNIYLYGVEDPRNRPLFASYKLKRLLEDRYRQRYLTGYCATPSCMDSPKSEWREMVAATMIRGVDIFTISTTLEQDQRFIAEFNESANKNHFNGVTHNCADFTKHVINTYFAHAVKSDYLNDFGMTSPKAVARTFTHYALHHPESNFRVMHFAQIPGTTKRSRIVRAGTEQLFHSGKLLIPLVLASYYAVPVVTTSYFTTGRFNAQKQFEHHPATDFPRNDSQPHASQSPDARAAIVGSPAQWKELRKLLGSVVAENSPDTPDNPKHFFKKLDETGTPSLDENGSAWVNTSVNGKLAKVGLSASNIGLPASDSTIASQFLLARAQRILKAPKHARETMLEFRQDWTDLLLASARNSVKKPSILALNFASEDAARGAANAAGSGQ